jgi:hypothetical protein
MPTHALPFGNHIRRRPLLLALCLTAGLLPAQPLCGDCDGNGAGPTIVDALAAAQIAAGLVAPSPAQQLTCEVDGAAPISVVDALVLAQAAASLPVSLACQSGSPPAVTFLSPQPGGTYWICCEPWPIDTMIEVSDPDGDPVTLTAELSSDGGATWFLANTDPCQAERNPMVGVATVTPTVVNLRWLGDFSTPQPVTLRVTATDGLHAASASLSPLHIDPPGGPVCVCVGPPSIVFVLDAGDSMAAVDMATTLPGSAMPSRFEVARADVKRALENVACSFDTFGVIVFNAQVHSWQPTLMAPTTANVTAASAWLDTFVAGGPSPYTPGVTAALQLGPGYPANVRLFSDGTPDGGTAEVSAITAANTYGAGISAHQYGPVTAAAAALLADLAASNSGQVVVVP